MMKLTKEECLDALTELSVYAKYIANKAEISSLFECYERLEQLINEHFELVEAHEKLKRENCGLRQQVLNLKEQMEKHYRNLR